MRTTKPAVAVAMLVTLATVGGCELYGPTATELDHGNSVRHMIQSQTLNPPTTDSTPVDSGDGDRVRKALETYRTDVSRPEAVKQELIIDVGGDR